MEWKLSDEQVAYQETFRDWLSKVATSSAVRDWLDEADASPFESRLIADGWAGVGLPEDLGGQGGGLLELALTAEELARSAAPSATWLGNVLATPALAGQPELVEGALNGDAVALLVPAESVPDSAPSLSVDGSGAVTGMVPRVLAGETATSFVVPVGSGDDRELRLVTVRGGGVEIRPRRLLDRTRSVADVTLTSAPSDALDVDPTSVLTEASARAAVLVAADSMGAAARMLDLAVEYGKQRHQFGVPIGSFQAVKHAAATILVGVEAARSVVYFAAASVDETHESRDPQWLIHAAAAKAQVTAAGVRAADSALTVHGAIGYTWEHDLQLFYKRAKLDESLFGTPAVWNERIADGLELV